jgi:ABC-2 type transport system permease protein
MRAAFQIAAKDLRQRLRDRSAVLVAVVLPLVLAFVYNLVFGSAGQPSPFRYAVVDLDRGTVAQAFVSGVLHEMQDRKVLTVQTVADEATGARLAERGSVDAVFVIPAGFSALATSDAPGHLDVIGNANKPTGAAVARAIAQSFVVNLNTVRVTVALGRSHVPPLSDGQVAALADQAAHVTTPVALRDVSAKRKLLDNKTYYAAGMAVFFLFFSVEFGVSSLIEERADGTLARLLSAPVPPSAILVGKLLTSVVVGLVSMTVLIVATSLLIGAHWGDPLAVALLVVSGVLAATGITALVCSVARTAEQAGSWQAIIASVLGLLGGVFFPIAQVGGLAAAASLATPHAWFIRGLSELAGGGGVADALPSVAALLGFAVATGAVAAIRLVGVVRP